MRQMVTSLELAYRSAETRQSSGLIMTMTMAPIPARPISLPAIMRERITGVRSKNSLLPMGRTMTTLDGAYRSAETRPSSRLVMTMTMATIPARPISFPAIRGERITGARSKNSLPEMGRPVTTLDGAYRSAETRPSSGLVLATTMAALPARPMCIGKQRPCPGYCCCYLIISV